MSNKDQSSPTKKTKNNSKKNTSASNKSNSTSNKSNSTSNKSNSTSNKSGGTSNKSSSGSKKNNSTNEAAKKMRKIASYVALVALAIMLISNGTNIIDETLGNDISTIEPTQNVTVNATNITTEKPKLTPIPQKTQVANIERSTFVDNPKVAESKYAFHALEVGKADCLLFRAGEKYMLVDGGNPEDKNYIIEYLKNLGIKKIDVVVSTHPHNDHIGSLDDIIRYFDVGRIYWSGATHTTKAFENLINAMLYKNITPIIVKAGDTFKLGDANISILAPKENCDYKNLNDWSVTLRIDAENTSFLLTGDIEAQSERDILANGANLDVDVLKVAHHGSKSSSIEAFYDAASPNIAVMTCDEFNPKEAPPFEVVLSRIHSAGTKLYRTDYNGVVIVLSDGEKIEVVYDREYP